MQAQYHYFVSSFDIWSSGEDLFEVIQRHKRDTKADIAGIYLVPLPPDAEYKINHFTPEVEGCYCIGVAGLNAKARKRLKEGGEYFNPFTAEYTYKEEA